MFWCDAGYDNTQSTPNDSNNSIDSTVLGAAIKSKQYSEITVESETHVKSVKITLNLFAVHSAPLLLSFYM